LHGMLDVSGHSSMIVAMMVLPPLLISTQAPQSVTVLKPPFWGRSLPGIAAKYVFFASPELAMLLTVSVREPVHAVPTLPVSLPVYPHAALKDDALKEKQVNSPVAPPFKPLPVPPTGAVNVQGPAVVLPPELEELDELLLLLLDPPELELLLDDELDARTSAPASFGGVPLEDPDEEEDPELELAALASAPASLPGTGAPELPEEEEPEALEPLLLVEPEAAPPLLPRPPPVLLLLGPPPSPVAESSPDEQAAATAATAKPKADTFRNRRIIQGLQMVGWGGRSIVTECGK
jgi:hypothetical protein